MQFCLTLVVYRHPEPDTLLQSIDEGVCACVCGGGDDGGGCGEGG